MLPHELNIWFVPAEGQQFRESSKQFDACISGERVRRISDIRIEYVVRTHDPQQNKRYIRNHMVKAWHKSDVVDASFFE